MRFKNAATGPGYNHVLNASQSEFIAAFCKTKRSYKSQPIGGGKNTVIGGPVAAFKKMRL